MSVTVYLGVENVYESSTIWHKLQTLKFTHQQTEYAVFTQSESLLSCPTQTPS